MALNFQTFKTRALTALLFVVIMLAGLLWNIWSFLILFTIIHFGCWWEYFKLVEKIYNTRIDIVIKWFFFICGFTLMLVFGLKHFWADFYILPFGFKISFKVLFWILEIICLAAFLQQNKQIPEKAKWMCIAGLFYISLSFTLLLNLRDNVFIAQTDINNNSNDISNIDLGRVYVCAIFFSLWINDTMAYIVGSFIGKTPLSKISPKKTVEGTVGGALLAIIVIGILGYFIHEANMVKVKDWIFIAAICAIAGTFGDLLESKLKRMAGVKDSGSIMPGHGGFLDRFDSLLLATPFVWLYVHLFL